MKQSDVDTIELENGENNVYSHAIARQDRGDGRDANGRWLPSYSPKAGRARRADEQAIIATIDVVCYLTSWPRCLLGASRRGDSTWLDCQIRSAIDYMKTR